MDEATVKNLLAPLFSQFGTADGDMAGKLMGYLIALEHSTPQALKAAVRSYLSGSVEGHDGKFIPTSAELARVVRAEQAHLDKLAPRLRIVDAGRPEPSPEARARMAAKLGKVISSTASAMSVGALNWQGFPGLQEFESWKLPTGTIFVAADKTVIYPDGAVESWAAIESRMRKPSPPKPSEPEPLAEEVAVAPSPELLAAMRRKEWLAKAERGEEASEPADPQAWRFETADTSV